MQRISTRVPREQVPEPRGFEVQGPGICDAQATRTTTLRNLSIKQENCDFTTINGDLMVNNGE